MAVCTAFSALSVRCIISPFHHRNAVGCSNAIDVPREMMKLNRLFSVQLALFCRFSDMCLFSILLRLRDEAFLACGEVLA